jgi:hypothetical protein
MANGLRASLLVLLGGAAVTWLLPRPFLRRVVAFVSRRKVALLLICGVALIPMIYLTFIVRHYGVNVPTLDDWAMAPLILKAHNGDLKWADIFHLQQEARTVLPNLIFILSAVSEWNVRDQMLVSVISCWLTAAGLLVLLLRSGLQVGAIAICFWLMVLAVFSPASYELWIFASGFPSFLPGLFLVAALVLVGGRWSTPWKFAGCVLLATASTFTLAHGMLLWALTFPALLIAQPPRRWRSWLGAWVAVAAVCVAAFFWGYERAPSLPRFGPPVALLEYLNFFLRFLGGSLAYATKAEPALAATMFATIELALLAAASIYLARRRKDRGLVIKVIPWFALALYSLASATLATLGRIDFGASYALASRYVPFSLGLTLAVIALVALSASDLVKRQALRARSAWIGAAVLVFLYLVPYEIAAKNTLFFLRAKSANDRLGHSAVLFSGVIDTAEVIRKNVFPPRPAHVVQYAAALDRLGLLRPSLARSNLLRDLPQTADRDRASGACEAIRTDNEVCHASGWAMLKWKARQADCVIVSYELPGAEPVLVAMSDSLELRWDIARHSWPNDYLWTGWKVSFPRNAVPPGAKLSFWAVDADGPTLHRLEDLRTAPARP